MSIKTIEARLEAKGKIVGKKINQIQNEYRIKVLQLDNMSDRILPFFGERLPHNRIVRKDDTLTVQGNRNVIKKLCRELN